MGMNKGDIIETVSIVRIERALETDAEALTQIQIEAYAGEVELYGAGPEGYDSLEVTLRRIRYRNYYKIIYNNKIAGGIFIYYPGGRTGILDGIFIKREYQGKGIAVKAVELVEKEFSQVEIWSVETPHKSYSNHRFYEKLGFVKVGEKDNFLFIYQKKETKNQSSEFVQTDMANADFANVNLSKAEFDYSCMNDNGFSHVELNDSRFVYCNMSKLKIYDTSMEGTEFKNVMFGNGNALTSSFLNCMAVGCAIKESDISDMTIQFSNMSGVQLYNVWLGGTTFQNVETGISKTPVKFISCELNGTEMNQCSLKNLRIDNCDISGMTIDGIPVEKMMQEYLKNQKK